MIEMDFGTVAVFGIICATIYGVAKLIIENL
jgi:hypothetical protein